MQFSFKANLPKNSFLKFYAVQLFILLQEQDSFKNTAKAAPSTGTKSLIKTELAAEADIVKNVPKLKPKQTLFFDVKNNTAVSTMKRKGTANRT